VRKVWSVGITLAVAGHLEISIESLAGVRKTGELEGPVLWASVTLVRSVKVR
jgi:acyl homoserine lactone synthase